MLDFTSDSITENNEVLVSNNCSVKNSNVKILTFFNGSGGVNNRVILEEGSRLTNVRIIIRGEGNIVDFKRGCFFNGTIHVTGKGKKVTIGSRTHVNGAEITCRDQNVIIGDDCLLSNKIIIRSSDTHKIFDAEKNEQINIAKRPVVISDNVWIGQDVFIGKNVKIPTGSVVAAGSTITRTIEEENVIIGGVRGEILKRNIRWEK